MWLMSSQPVCYYIAFILCSGICPVCRLCEQLRIRSCKSFTCTAVLAQCIQVNTQTDHVCRCGSTAKQRIAMRKLTLRVPLRLFIDAVLSAGLVVWVLHLVDCNKGKNEGESARFEVMGRCCFVVG
jgi:hypothetical protein